MSRFEKTLKEIEEGRLSMLAAFEAETAGLRMVLQRVRCDQEKAEVEAVLADIEQRQQNLERAFHEKAVEARRQWAQEIREELAHEKLFELPQIKKLATEYRN